MKALNNLPLSVAFVCLTLSLSASPSHAIDITGYSSSQHDLYSSGFPSSPTTNTNANFIGLGYDWSGFAWSTTPYFTGYKGFAMLSPQHFLTAQHYEYGVEETQGVNVLAPAPTVSTANTDAILNLGQGLSLTVGPNTNYDLAVGRLQVPVLAPSELARYAVLDLHATSTANTLSNYNGLQIFLTGRGPTSSESQRIGSTTINLAAVFNSDPKQIALRTTRTDVQLQLGDSGYAAYHGWTNPNGDKELTVLGTNSAATVDHNFVSFLGSTDAMAAANIAMTPQGFVLRTTGNPFATWQGGTGTSAQQDDLFRNQNWGGPLMSPADQYTLFNGNTTSFLNIDVDSSSNIRGLFFKATASTTKGFTFASPTNTLTIGRGGIVNYDISRQIFTANLALGDHQYWNVGPGGVTIANLNTSGRLLEIAGSGTAIINGIVSGTGGLALSGTRLEMTATSSYTGTTWVHQGRLEVTGSIATSSGVRLGKTGELSGTGVVPIISGSGSVHPGLSPGILTASGVDPTGGLDFFFEFTQTGSPLYSNAAASLNDVLRLTSSTPFLASLSSTNTVNVFLDVAGLSLGDVFRGGFYTDESAAFDTELLNAQFVFHLADVLGPVLYDSKTYSVYTGPFLIQVGTVAEVANFGSGPVNGRVMELSVIPEPNSAILILCAATLLGWHLRRQNSSSC